MDPDTFAGKITNALKAVPVTVRISRKSDFSITVMLTWGFLKMQAVVLRDGLFPDDKIIPPVQAKIPASVFRYSGR